RFQQEAQAVSTLDHPNIMRIYDFSGPDLEQLWLVAEIINGTTLASMQQARPNRHLPEVIATCIVREIARALEHAHRSGIVHRDIKPENVMVTLDGRLKLMDFGIAKDTQKHKKTVTGMFMGSPSYMSQEQVKGRNVDGRSDIYSLGVLFYELLTGRLPFEGASSADVVEKISKGEFVYPRFRTHGLSMEIDRMVVRCMQKNPESRFQSVGELGSAIDAWLTSKKVFSSAMELESHILRNSTQPPQEISDSPELETVPDREPATPYSDRAQSGKKTKVRTAQPRLIRPVDQQNSKANAPQRRQHPGMRRPPRPIQIRQTFIRNTGSQTPVLLAIAVALVMAFLWLTDFRILKVIKNSTQS
ncbi:MAG: serine/threonine protein kinase, partial [Proteobacteria bacterium]|nr:serine/threonine protein kinase [Pseudomonadota bacterium]